MGSIQSWNMITNARIQSDDGSESKEKSSEAESTAVTFPLSPPRLEDDTSDEEWIILTVVARLKKGPANVWMNVKNALKTHCSIVVSHRMFLSLGDDETRVFLGKAVGFTSERSSSLLAHIAQLPWVERAFYQTRDLALKVHHSHSFLADRIGMPTSGFYSWKEGFHRPLLLESQCILKALPVRGGARTADEFGGLLVQDYQASKDGSWNTLVTNKKAKAFAERKPVSVAILWKHPDNEKLTELGVKLWLVKDF